MIHYPVFGGPHNQALRLNKELAARGWQTIVAIPEEEGNAAPRLQEAGVETRRLPLTRARAKLDPRLHWQFITGFPHTVRAIRRTIKDEKIDLVVLGGLVNPHAAIAARLEKTPVVWQLLDTRTPAPVVRLLMPLVLRFADSVMTTGAKVANFHPGLSRIQRRVFSFFPPVDTELFAPSDELKFQARRMLGISEDATVVGSVSNINPQKGQVNFARAASKLHKVRPDIIFVLLGATYPQHAEYLAEIERTAKDGGLVTDESFIIHDPGSEVPLFGSLLDVFWLTSEPRSEGIPTVVEEAMALGKAVVTFDVGAVREAVDHNENGLVVDSHNAGELANATHALLNDRSEQVRLARNARQFAESKFALSACAEVHIRAFDEALRHAKSIRRHA